MRVTFQKARRKTQPRVKSISIVPMGSLLNAHRDVLAEIGLNLDDLYSWTPVGLRRVVLDSILSMDREQRRRLYLYWRFSTEDRRSQVISLLALNTFRPRMASVEPTSDDKVTTIRDWMDKNKNPVLPNDSLQY